MTEKTYWQRKEKYIGLTWRLLVQFIFQSVRPNNKQICLMKCKITSFKLKAQRQKRVWKTGSMEDWKCCSRLSPGAYRSSTFSREARDSADKTVIGHRSSNYRQPSTVNCQPSTVNGQWSMVIEVPSTVNRQPPTANRQPPTANRQPPTINH